MSDRSITVPFAMADTIPFLTFAINARREAVSDRLMAMEPEAFQPAATEMIQSLVNPVHFATVLALCGQGVSDAETALDAWFAGMPTPGLEADFLSLESFADQADIGEAARASLRILTALCHTAMLTPFSMQERDMMRPQIADIWRSTLEADETSAAAIKKYETRRTVWGQVNPQLGLISDGKTRESVLFAYGFEVNSAQHNEREAAESAFETAKRDLNASLKTGDAAVRDAGLKHLEDRRALAARAREFYHWNPTEIDAHRMEAMIKREMAEAEAGGGKAYDA